MSSSFLPAAIAFAGLWTTFPALHAGPVVVIESDFIHAYFGTATLLGPDGHTVVSTGKYLFLDHQVSDGLAALVQADTAASAFSIFQNQITSYGTLADPEYLLEIFDTCSNKGFSNGIFQPFYNPADKLTFLASPDSQLTKALNSPVLPPGFFVKPISDSGDQAKGTLSYVIFAPTPSPNTIFRLRSQSVCLSKTLHFRNPPVPEPSSWVVMGTGLAALILARFLQSK